MAAGKCGDGLTWQTEEDSSMKSESDTVNGQMASWLFGWAKTWQDQSHKITAVKMVVSW